MLDQILPTFISLVVRNHEIKGEFNFRYNDGDESTLTESR